MLGTLRMDIQTCIDEYLELAPEIPRRRSSTRDYSCTKFISHGQMDMSAYHNRIRLAEDTVIQNCTMRYYDG